MSLIFEETKTLTPNDTKTNVPLQFYVAEELEKMKIEFSYSPKNLDDEEKAHKYIDDGFEKYAPEPYRKGYKPWYEYLPVKNQTTQNLLCLGSIRLAFFGGVNVCQPNFMLSPCSIQARKSIAIT